MSEPIWTGELTPPDKQGLVHLVIRDNCGWPIPMEGTWDAEAKVYRLRGVVPPPPAHLFVAGIDG